LLTKTETKAVADTGGANPAIAPPSKLAMEFGPPSRTERAMEVL